MSGPLGQAVVAQDLLRQMEYLAALAAPVV
jgi:hypothetical protein